MHGLHPLLNAENLLERCTASTCILSRDTRSQRKILHAPGLKREEVVTRWAADWKKEFCLCPQSVSCH